MPDLEYHTEDKSAWGDGPWQDEPDKIQYTDEATGLPCLVKRNRMGALCGYVGVPNGHPLFGLGFGDSQIDGLDVHGGVTYGDRCQEGDEAHSICHVPGPGEPDDVWWIGFDCAHSRDVMPAFELQMKNLDPDWKNRRADGGSYKTVEYVKEQNSLLALQLAKENDD